VKQTNFEAGFLSQALQNNARNSPHIFKKNYHKCSSYYKSFGLSAILIFPIIAIKCKRNLGFFFGYLFQNSLEVYGIHFFDLLV